MPQRKAFTLVELLVVIAILALLLSILVPTVTQVTARARQNTCMHNLKQWGNALLGYRADNMSFPLAWHIGGSPSAMWYEHNIGNPKNPAFTRGEISYEKMQPYLPGLDTENEQVTGAWICPAVASQIDYGEFGLFPKGAHHAAHSHYSYFIGAGGWWNSIRDDLGKDPIDVTHPEDFVDLLPEEGKIMMADVILGRPDKQGWMYNHGLSGPRPIFDDSSRHINPAQNPLEISGINILYGGGNAEWQPASQMNLEKMHENPSAARHAGWDHFY